jgi:hypothetical protein
MSQVPPTPLFPPDQPGTPTSIPTGAPAGGAGNPTSNPPELAKGLRRRTATPYPDAPYIMFATECPDEYTSTDDETGRTRVCKMGKYWAWLERTIDAGSPDALDAWRIAAQKVGASMLVKVENLTTKEANELPLAQFDANKLAGGHIYKVRIRETNGQWGPTVTYDRSAVGRIGAPQVSAPQSDAGEMPAWFLKAQLEAKEAELRRAHERELELIRKGGGGGGAAPSFVEMLTLIDKLDERAAKRSGGAALDPIDLMDKAMERYAKWSGTRGPTVVKKDAGTEIAQKILDAAPSLIKEAGTVLSAMFKKPEQAPQTPAPAPEHAHPQVLDAPPPAAKPVPNTAPPAPIPPAPPRIQAEDPWQMSAPHLEVHDRIVKVLVEAEAANETPRFLPVILAWFECMAPSNNAPKAAAIAAGRYVVNFDDAARTTLGELLAARRDVAKRFKWNMLLQLANLNSAFVNEACDHLEIIEWPERTNVVFPEEQTAPDVDPDEPDADEDDQEKNS